MPERRTNKGLYICIDGVDGSGKTTQTHMLRDHFESSQLRVGVVPFVPMASKPLRLAAARRYGEESAMRVSFSRSHVEYVHACEQYLNFQDHVAPKLATHDVVIQDRSKLSRLVNARYAGAPMEDVHAILEEFPDPDALFCLQLSPITALHRITQRGQAGLDETSDYITVASEYYENYAASLNACLIDAERGPQEVHAAIISQLSRLAMLD